MKKFTFKGVLDGFRQSVQPQAIRQEQEIQEQLKPDHFTLKKVRRERERKTYQKQAKSLKVKQYI